MATEDTTFYMDTAHASTIFIIIAILLLGGVIVWLHYNGLFPFAKRQ